MRRSLLPILFGLGLIVTGMGTALARPDQNGSATPASPSAVPSAPTTGVSLPVQPTSTEPSDFCLRLLPGWSVRPNGAALRLVAPAGADRPSAEFRLDMDILPGALKAGQPLPHDALIAQAKAHLSLFLRDISEDVDARQIFSTPDAAGIIYRMRGLRKSDGQETVSLVYALIGEGGTRTALLTPLAAASSAAFGPDLDALLRTLRFLPRKQTPVEPTQEFVGRLLPGENRFYLWLRDRGDAEAVWKTTTAAGEEVSARFAGSYTLSGRLMRVALLRTGGENPYVTRLLELNLAPAGSAVQGTVRLDQARPMTLKELQLIHVKFAQDRP